MKVRHAALFTHLYVGSGNLLLSTRTDQPGQHTHTFIHVENKYHWAMWLFAVFLKLRHRIIHFFTTPVSWAGPR